MSEQETGVLSLATMDGGAVVEQFDDAIQRVLENIVDPNTKAKAVRTVTLKVKLVPADEERELLGVQAEVKTSMAPAAPLTGKAWVVHTRNGVVCVEDNPNQRKLFDEEEPAPLQVVHNQGGAE
jgi:hypothetical protein